MMFGSMLVDEESSCDYVSMPEDTSEQQFQFRFLHPRCRNQYNVYKNVYKNYREKNSEED